MAPRIGMVTADCTDPTALAAFWARVLQTSVVFEVEGFVMPEGNEFCVGER